MRDIDEYEWGVSLRMRVKALLLSKADISSKRIIISYMNSNVALHRVKNKSYFVLKAAESGAFV